VFIKVIIVVQAKLTLYFSQQVADMPKMLHTLQTTAHAIKATTQQTHKNTVGKCIIPSRKTDVVENLTLRFKTKST